jgi:hypothetical protein
MPRRATRRPAYPPAPRPIWPSMARAGTIRFAFSNSPQPWNDAPSRKGFDLGRACLILMGVACSATWPIGQSRHSEFGRKDAQLRAKQGRALPEVNVTMPPKVQGARRPLHRGNLVDGTRLDLEGQPRRRIWLGQSRRSVSLAPASPWIERRAATAAAP